MFSLVYNHLELLCLLFLEWAFYIYRGSESSCTVLFIEKPRTGQPNTDSWEGPLCCRGGWGEGYSVGGRLLPSCQIATKSYTLWPWKPDFLHNFCFFKIVVMEYLFACRKIRQLRMVFQSIYLSVPWLHLLGEGWLNLIWQLGATTLECSAENGLSIHLISSQSPPLIYPFPLITH